MKKTNWNSNFAVLSDKRSFQLQPLHALKDTLRVPAFDGGKYLFTVAAGTALSEDLTAARAGNDLYVSLRSTGWEKPAVIVEDFYARQGEVYGMDSHGAYQRLLSADGASPQGPAALAAESVGFWHQQQEVVALHHIMQLAQLQADSAQSVLAGPAAEANESAAAVQPAVADASPVVAMATALPAGADAPAPAAAPALDKLPLRITHIVDDVSAIGEVRELGPNTITDDKLPAIFGTGPAGAQLEILDGSVVIGSVAVGMDGNWSFMPEIPFAEAGHILSVRDAVTGAVSASSFIFIIDTIAPGSTSITSVIDNLLNPQGDPIANGGYTKDNTPTLSGKSEPNSLVTIYNFGVPVASIGSDVRTGAWSWTPLSPLLDGEYKFSARASDFAGNQGLASRPYTITVDTIPVPTAMATIVGITDDTGMSATDFITSDNTLLVRVALDRALNPGEVVQVSLDNGASWVNAAVYGNHWVYDNTANALAEGERTLQARVLNTKGETGPITSQDIVIDFTKPVQSVSIETYVDDAGESQGEFSFAAAASTDDKSPLLKGSLDVALGNGERVGIYRDGVYLGIADAAGTSWQYQDEDLSDGRHVYTARVIDAAGNAGTESEPVTLTREEMLTLNATDTVVHEAALLNGTGIDWAANDGSSTSDLRASGGFTLGGTVTKVNFTLGGEEKTVNAGDLAGNPVYKMGGDTLAIISHGSGKYSYTYTLNTPKTHDTSGGVVGERIGNDLTIKALDANGKWVSETGRIEIVNDEVQASSDDFYIAKAGAGVQGVNITMAVDYSASMASHFPALRSGLKSMLDGYGSAYTPGTPMTFTLFCWDGSSQPLLKTKTMDTIDAAKAWIDQALGAGTTGWNPNWTEGVNLIQDAVQKSMNLHPGWDQKVYFISDGSPGSGQMTPDMLETPQSWKDFISGPNTDIIDVYGIGFESGQRLGAVQKVLNPNDAGDKYYAVSNDGSLAAILGSTVVTEGNLFDSTNPIGGHQSIVLGADGGFTLTSVQVGSTTYTFEAGDSVTVPLQDGGAMKIFKDGTFTLTQPSGNANFAVPMTFELRDADGDAATIAETLRFGAATLVGQAQSDPGDATSQAPVTVLFPAADAPMPAAATAFGDLPLKITHIVDDVSAIGEVRELGANSVTDDKLPAIFGTGPAGARLEILDGSVVIGSVTVGMDGNWSFMPEIPFSEAGHILSVRDAVTGAVSASSFIFIVDTIAPGSTSITSVIDNLLNPEGDPIASGGHTKDNTPTISGKSEPNSLVTIYNFGVPVASISSDVRTGEWSWTPLSPLLDGEYKFSAQASDFVGNRGLASPSYTITVDTIPEPTATATIVGITEDTGLSATDFITSDNTLLVRVELDRALNPGEVVQVSLDNGASWVNAAEYGNQWVYDNTANALAEGERTLQARVLNTKGETGPITSQDIVIDFTKPVQSVSIDTYVDDAGESQGEFSFGAAASTDDKSPLLKGSLDVALGNGERVGIYRDGVYLGIADATGTSWQYQDEDLSDGRHVYTARVIDAAGNAGTESGPVTLIREEMLTLQATDTVVHEAALVNGTGIDWAANDGSSTSDLTAGGVFTLGGTVASVTFTLGGQSVDVPVSGLIGARSFSLGGDTLAVTPQGDGKYAYSYTLRTAKTHETAGGNVGETVHNDLTITASDGTNSKTLKGDIVVVNDEMITSPGDFHVPIAGALGVSLTFMVDYSPVMTKTGAGVVGKVLWDLTKESIFKILDSYAAAADNGMPIEINIIPCSRNNSTPSMYSIPTWTFDSIFAAKQMLTSYEGSPWSTPSNATVFLHDALNTTQASLENSLGAHPGWDHKLYVFDADGPSSSYTVPDSWTDFVQGPAGDRIDVYAVNAKPQSPNPKLSQLINPDDPDDAYLQIDDPIAMAEVSQNTVFVTGNVLEGQSGGSQNQGIVLGADGGFSLSKVSIDGEDYMFGAEDSVTVAIGPGATMAIHKNGAYELKANGSIQGLSKSMSFELVDADGDTATIVENIQFGTPAVETQGASLTFMVDYSAVMINTSAGVVGKVLWDLTKESIFKILDSYASAVENGMPIEINIIPCSRNNSTPSMYSIPTWTFDSIFAAKQMLTSYEGSPWSAVSNGMMVLSDALDTTQASLENSLGAHPGWDHKLYVFDADGPSYSYTVPDSWTDFVQGPAGDRIDVYAVNAKPQSPNPKLSQLINPDDPDDAYLQIDDPIAMAGLLHGTAIAIGDSADGHNGDSLHQLVASSQGVESAQAPGSNGQLLKLVDLLSDGNAELFGDSPKAAADAAVSGDADVAEPEELPVALDGWVAQVDVPVDTGATDAYCDAAASLRPPVEEQEAIGLM